MSEMGNLFVGALMVGLIALAVVGLLYVHFKRKFKDRPSQERS